MASAAARRMANGFCNSVHSAEIPCCHAQHALDFLINGMFARFVVTHVLPSLSWLLYAPPPRFRRRKKQPNPQVKLFGFGRRLAKDAGQHHAWHKECCRNGRNAGGNAQNGC